MATTYTSTITVNVWKEHTCVCCGGKYRYLFVRKKTGTGGSPDIASANAERAVVTALAHEVDVQACPECGVVQPDMVAVRRVVGHWIIFGIAAVVLPLIIILTATDVLSLGTSAWSAGITCAACLLFHMMAGLGNPNANLEANASRARERLEKGVLWAPNDNKPDPNGQVPYTGLTSAGLLVYALLGLCAIGCALPELMRVARGWPLNPDWYPAVVGPGDESYIYFPVKVTSVKGHWRGTVSAQVTASDDPSLTVPVQATTRTDNWPQNITIGKGGKTSTNTVWARVKFPEDSKLAGKKLDVQLTNNVTYPKLMGEKQFEDRFVEPYTAKSTLVLASLGAGSAYRMAWYFGVFGGTAGVLLLSIALALQARGLRNLALPTQIFVPEGPGNPQ